MSRTKSSRTRGIWLPEEEAAAELVLARKRQAIGAPADDARPIAMCTACGYLGFCEEIPSLARRHARVLICEECRGLDQSAERKPAAREIALVRRKTGAA